MKTNWPTKKLSEVAKIYQPKTITSKEIKKEGPFKVFGANGVIGYFDKFNHEEKEIAITCRGATCGTINMTEPKSWITGNAMVVSPISDALSKEYLYYELLGLDIGTTISGSAQPQITRQALAPFEVKIPPLPIQRKIVERLDAIRKAQELNDLQISRAQELFESVVNNLILNGDFPTKRLGDIAEIISGQSPRSINYNKNGDGWPLYQGKRDFGSMFTADPEVWTTEKTKVVKRFDILISVRAPVGPVNLANCEMNIGRGLAAIRPWEDVDYLFLFYFLQSQEKNIAKLGSGSTFQSVNRSELQNQKIPIPPIETQQKIVEKLNAVQDYKKTLLKQKDLLKELFDSVLHKSINGELDS